MCPECGAPPLSARATYCSNSCRQAAYYARRARTNGTMIIGVVTGGPESDGQSPGDHDGCVSARQRRLNHQDAIERRRLKKSDRSLMLDALDALYEHAARGGTAIGFGTILVRVAAAHGIDGLTAPRLPRAVREEISWDLLSK